MDKQARRDAVVFAALQDVPFDGWSAATLRRAAERTGGRSDDADLLFPGGAGDAVAHFVDLADRLMVADLAARDLGKLRHRDKIALIVRLRLERWTPHREAVRRALALLPLSAAAGLAMRGMFGTVDAMWRAIGDRSIDFSFYTKRMLLAGVYGATVLYWLDDRSEGCRATWGFLERRLDEVMRLPKTRSRIADGLKMIPNPVRIVKRLAGRRWPAAPGRTRV